MEDDKVTKDIATLEQMNAIAEVEPQAVIEARLHKKPIEDVEKSLSSFTQHTFDIIRDEYNFQKSIEDEIQRRLMLDEKQGGFNTKELIALHTNNSVNLNDRVSKVLGPTFQLMTAQQQAEIAARAQVEKQQAQVNINVGSQESMRNLNETCGKNNDESQAILQGLNQLQNLLTAMDVKSTSEK